MKRSGMRFKVKSRMVGKRRLTVFYGWTIQRTRPKYWYSVRVYYRIPPVYVPMTDEELREWRDNYE